MDNISQFLQAIGLNGEYTITDPGGTGRTFTIQWQGDLASVNFPSSTTNPGGNLTLTGVSTASPTGTNITVTPTNLPAAAQTNSLWQLNPGNQAFRVQLTVGGKTQVSSFGNIGPTPSIQNIIDELNGIPTLQNNFTVLGKDGGPFAIVFNNNLAGFEFVNGSLGFSVPGNATFTHVATATGAAVQQIEGPTANSVPTGTVTFSFNGANTFSPITFTATTTAQQVLTNLNLIDQLNGNVDVFGPNGGPFQVVFVNELLGQNISANGITGLISDDTTVTNVPRCKTPRRAPRSSVARRLATSCSSSARGTVRCSSALPARPRQLYVWCYDDGGRYLYTRLISDFPSLAPSNAVVGGAVNVPSGHGNNPNIDVFGSPRRSVLCRVLQRPVADQRAADHLESAGHVLDGVARHR